MKYDKIKKVTKMVQMILCSRNGKTIEKDVDTIGADYL
jgi:hypothetical protein